MNISFQGLDEEHVINRIWDWSQQIYIYIKWNYIFVINSLRLEQMEIIMGTKLTRTRNPIHNEF